MLQSSQTQAGAARLPPARPMPAAQARTYLVRYQPLLTTPRCVSWGFKKLAMSLCGCQPASQIQKLDISRAPLSRVAPALRIRTTMQSNSKRTGPRQSRASVHNFCLVASRHDEATNALGRPSVARSACRCRQQGTHLR